MEVNICIPVLRRYDLLKELLRSLQTSSVRPNRVVIIDNGFNIDRELGCVGTQMKEAIAEAPCPVTLHYGDKPMGVAEAWNWFLRNVPEERIITNDDVTFGRESLAIMTAPKADLVWAAGCGFSCFLIRDTCVEKLGNFDETISPGYGYYEDCDYLMRLDGRGTRAPSAIACDVDAHVHHERSSTLLAANDEERAEHHVKFRLAQRNYMTKWGITQL